MIGRAYVDVLFSSQSDIQNMQAMMRSESFILIYHIIMMENNFK